jgi:hypothetical protein
VYGHIVTYFTISPASLIVKAHRFMPRVTSATGAGYPWQLTVYTCQGHAGSHLLWRVNKLITAQTISLTRSHTIPIFASSSLSGLSVDSENLLIDELPALLFISSNYQRHRNTFLSQYWTIICLLTCVQSVCWCIYMILHIQRSALLVSCLSVFN